MSRPPPLSALLLSLALTAAAPRAAAEEIGFPSRSPYASVSQWVGLTDITVGYFSPAVAGRKLWGSVVAPGAVWLIGDGAAPTVTLSEAAVVGGVAIPAGTYALLAIPAAGGWTMILNRRSSLWRAADRDPALDVARFPVQVERAPHRERLTFLFSDFTAERATLDLEWDAWRVRIPLGLRTDEQVGRTLRSLDDAWRRYADAARYLLEKKHDIDGGLAYVDKSLALRETWTNVWVKASLLAARGDYPGARAAAARAYELGRAEGTAFTLEPEVKEALATWAEAPTHPARPRAGHARRQARADRARARLAVPDRAEKSAIVDGEPFPAATERPASPPPSAPPSPSAFAPLIKAGRPDLERCYQRALREDPALGRAQVTVTIAIAPSGHVTRVGVEPPPKSGTLTACLRDAVARWPFPPAPADYEAQVPLTLRAK